MKSIEELQKYNEMPDIIREIADVFGEELAKDFHKAFAGSLIYIPKHYSSRQTIARIMSECQEVPLWKIQRDYNLSRNTILKYRRLYDRKRTESNNSGNNKGRREHSDTNAQDRLFDCYED